MSQETLARRTTAEVAFGSLDLTGSIQKFLLSLSYTDNEDDKADSLTIKLQDRGLGWMQKWLDEAIQAALETVEEKTYIVTAQSGLNIRKEPNAESEKLGALPYGAEVTVSEIKNGWATITYEGQTAYVSANYLKAADAEEKSYTVTARSGLNVRKGAGTENAKIGSLPYGAEVTVSEIKNGWATITYEGQTAYVSANYLQENDAAREKDKNYNYAVVGGKTVPAMFTAYYPANNAVEGGFYDALGNLLDPSKRTMAAPPSIPFGTKITIQGTDTERDGQTYTVNDRGGAIQIKNGVYHFDILMSSNSQCNRWGVKYGRAIIGGARTRTRINLGAGVADTKQAGAESREASAPETPPEIETETVSQSASQKSTRVSALRIQAALVQKNWKSDGKDKVLDCGQFELDSITASGPPATATIRATALPYRAAVRNAARSQAWEGYKLSGIARELADANGLVCMFESANDPFYQRVEQYRQSDLDFLSDLCKQAGVSLKLTNNIMILFDQAEYEAKDAIRTVKRGDGSYSSYELKYDAGNTKYDSCRVSYTDPTTKKCIVGIAYSEDYKENAKEERRLEIKEKVADENAALALAEKQLRLYNKYAQTAAFTMIGDSDLIAGVTVQLENFGSWNGKYIVRQAVHTLDANGYTTKISLRAVLPDSASVVVFQNPEASGETQAAAVTEAAAMVAAASGEVGYHESGENNNKFGAWAGDNGAAWCAYFVSWCGAQTGASFPMFGYVGDFTDYFQKRGQYRSANSGYIPQPGDLMIQGDRHIGIVESADENAVYTIEGNYSDSVSRVTRSYGEITGFCTPW